MPSRMLRLDSPARHTPWSVFQNVRRNTGSRPFLLRACTRVVTGRAFRAPSLHRHLISGPIAPPLFGVLFSVHSRYLFAIGLGSCLVLAVDAGHIDEGYPTLATLDLAHAVLVSATGLSPCIALRSRRLRGDGPTMRASPNTTLPEGFGLDWAAFTRRY
jgi:hypothetical protein